MGVQCRFCEQDVWMEPKNIEIRGAREHNLRGVSLTLPRNRLICLTGVSGSGKSSLAFDTLYAEGQRRYIESLSSYARQFLGQLAKPDVDQITGLSPSISIQQKAGGWNPRSTVGTITQIQDYLRVLFARAGTQHCPECDRPISAQTGEQISGSVLARFDGRRVLVLAPVVRGQKGEYRDLFEDLVKAGYTRARVDGRMVRLTEDVRLDRNIRHDIELVIDRLSVSADCRARLAEAVEAALQRGEGTLVVAPAEESDGSAGTRKRRGVASGKDAVFSSKYACVECGLGFEPPSPRMMSFNSPTGMCLTCDGLGSTYDFDPERCVPNPSLSVFKGAIVPMHKPLGRWRRHIYRGVADHVGFDIEKPWKDLSTRARDALLYGTGDDHITFTWRRGRKVWRHGGTFDGILDELHAKHRRAKSEFVRKYYEKFMRTQACADCGGGRLNSQALAVRLGGQNLPDVCKLSVADAAEFFANLKLDGTRRIIAEEPLKEVCGRLEFLMNVGLHYLTLDRSAPTLSGGESQRIRLASQIGCGLVGVLYILDEPSIGLHARDNKRLLEALHRLRDMGNTVVVVEHDEETMWSADHVVDFGPGPGHRGGEVVAAGTIKQIARARRSVTGQYLSGKKEIPVPDERRYVDTAKRRGVDTSKRRGVDTSKCRGVDTSKGQAVDTAKRRNLADAGAKARGNGGTNGKVKWLTVVGAEHNNLKSVDVHLPLGRFVCVTGVSGSGKSSLVNDILHQQLAADLNGAENVDPGRHTRINGKHHLDKVIDIDQTPIGRTPRSNPATYIKVFDHIRALYAKLPDSRVRGYKPGRFSFNVATGPKGGGRCDACEGNGATKMEMDFLADVWVTCPVCSGLRFNRETLQARYKGKSIADVLGMEVAEALEHFENIPKIRSMLQTLHDVGLDYLKLGQSSTTLSGGEAQRIKLARELVKVSTGRTLYLLDEPTTGLHFEDIVKLLEVLHGFVNAGNSVVVIEHNLDVIKTADWVVDLGPEGGECGGYVVATGTPETVAETDTYTGQSLRQTLGMNGRRREALVRRGNGGRASGKKKPGGGRNGRIRNISVVGARQHNLKDLTVDVPREKITVCSGLSGSGKSSFAIDTVYSEGQRRYVESLSAYARQFLGQLQKPKVDRIDGLSPAISIEQKSAARSPRSTVGTVTEIYDYMRVLWSRIGQPYCPKCDVPIGTQTVDEIVDRVMSVPRDSRLLLLSPIERTGNERYEQLFERQRASGFARVRVDGQVYELADEIDIDRRRRHEVEVVVDRVIVRERQRGRIADSVEMALSVGGGRMVAHRVASGGDGDGEDLRFSQHFACDKCGTSYEELTPHHFSFNSRLGWCESCEGLGTQRGANSEAVVIQPSKSVIDGALAGWRNVSANPALLRMVSSLADHIGFDMHRPWQDLTAGQQREILYGTGDVWLTAGDTLPGVRFQWKGFFPAISEATKASWHYRKGLDHLATELSCRQCGGSRLMPEAAAVRLGNKTIVDVCSMPLDRCLRFFKRLSLDRRERQIAGELMNEVTSRLEFLVDVGLTYLTLHRPAPTLSGGESQRIRLASQIGSGLTGVLYVLDEPTIGLHPRDNARLVGALNKLRDLGNTLLLVEHDRQVIDNADHVLDFGPGAGVDGGRIVAGASPDRLRRKRASLTGKYLSGKKAITIPTNRRPVDPIRRRGPDQDAQVGDPIEPDEGGRWLTVVGARHHNLENVDVELPLGRFIVVTGVSGSGKSSLVAEILYPALAKRLHRARLTPGAHEAIRGIELVDKVINVDQQAIGNSPSSNPATYTGVFDLVRELFAKLPDSKIRGYSAERFSFNRPGGRCEACWGNGQVCIEMHFLPDVWVACEECDGKRYNTETLAVKYRGKSIADILAMRVSEALQHFQAVPKVRRMLQTLADVGLEYVQLGQPAPTLSGGEAQRVKLASELGRPTTGKTVYILDEPTTGLHFHDLRKLLDVLNRLVDMGNTVICIEHNMDVIKTADWVIDLGPEAGNAGGDLVAAGTPEFVVGQDESHTGKILAVALADGPYAERPVFDAKAHAAAELGAEKLVPDDIGDAKMPWQVDGRAWHTRQRPDRAGREIQWQGEALEFVVDRIVELGQGRFAEPEWNNQVRVEIKSPGSKVPWFFHALTGGEWLLDLNFRIPRGRFKRDTLAGQIGLKALDEREDLPVYGQWQRCYLRRVDNALDRIRVLPHDLPEVDTPAFRRFLADAVSAYLEHVDSLADDPDKAEPWKTAGKQWHLQQRGMVHRHRAVWQPTTLVQIIGAMQKAVPGVEADWKHKIAIILEQEDVKGWWCRVVSAKAEHVELQFRAKPGQFTPAMIDGIGPWQRIKRSGRAGGDEVIVRLRDVKQLNIRAFKTFLKAYQIGVREAFPAGGRSRS